MYRSVNRHKRSQSSPLNLPVDIPEVSSGDEGPVGSPSAQAREHATLIQEVSTLHYDQALQQKSSFSNRGTVGQLYQENSVILSSD